MRRGLSLVKGPTAPGPGRCAGLDHPRQAAAGMRIEGVRGRLRGLLSMIKLDSGEVSY